jgi:peptidoglycan hydrolase-like protein with peptidoglycan-binding domain
MRRRTAIAALGLGAAAAGWLGFSSLAGGDDAAEPRASRTGPTATVARQTLVARELVDGTLGYADARTLVHRLEGSGGSSGGDGGDSGGAGGGSGGGGGDDGGSGGGGSSGTLTRTARPGSVVRRGGVLYWVDGDPVLLMYGSTPTYRTLTDGIADGPDVEQLEENLAVLGFDPGIVDEEFTSSTTSAVEDWQESQGLEETGQVELGRVVFFPSARRVGARKTAIGSALAEGGEVLDTTSTRRVVKVELDVAKQSFARRGDGVRVTLPGGATVRGRITRVGHVAHAKSGSGGGGMGDDSGDQELVVDVTIALRSARGTRRYDQAPVSVALASEQRRNALVVPVEALLARRGGDYAVELAGSGRRVPVRTGLFADGQVAVAGQGIHEGTRVRVPE